MSIDVDKLYQEIKNARERYTEDKHCKLILKIMADPHKGRVSSFCISVGITEETFYKWLRTYPLFNACYQLGRMYARESWEIEGYELRDHITPPGTINHAFEHWKLIGWSRFGVSKNSRIKLSLNPDGTPHEHYKQVIKQATEGDFTAAEIKQLMEAVNVGLNSHQVFELQKQIDQLKSDLAIMTENANAQNISTNKGIEKKD